METVKGTITCDCGHLESEHSKITRGYATDSDGKTWCYDCALERELADMRTSGKATLYLTKDSDGNHIVSNWPGTFKRKVTGYRVGRHNIARKRYDAYFGFEGYWWHAVSYGDNTEIAHCKRTKQAI